MLLEKLHAMTYAMQHGSHKEFEDARTELTIACREADEKLVAAQQSVQLTGLTVAHCEGCGAIMSPEKLCVDCDQPRR